ncbi:translation initiation factor 2 [Oribacterium sinus]|uniref:translation initiation factor 2 n=1 Tax=Oribacterium sinus TaxID=237576 RepID=UPI0028E34FAA|nr:translation initiation factor 2 [Oribacterium sinus]
MKGMHHIVIQNKRIRFAFSIKRNITIIRGDSATGKTTLFSMIEEYGNLGKDSGVQIQCDKACVALSGKYWQETLENIHDSIVFVDEDSRFLKTKDFAKRIRNSNNYYVLITRENLPALPYSVEEIYGIHCSGRYMDTRQVYNLFYKIYSETNPGKLLVKSLVTEDSQAGFTFFSQVAMTRGICCESADGKSNILGILQKRLLNKEQKETLVIADGAAFGPEMAHISQLLRGNSNIKLYLPESFEWLLLYADILNKPFIRKRLEEAENYIESEKYFSWERYFTDLLMEETEDSPYPYDKSNLKDFYLQDKVVQKVLEAMAPICLAKE